MKKIKEYVDLIEDELCSAKDYVEKALWYKAKDNSERYNTYKQMSMQELEHALHLHQFAMEDIEKLEKVYPDIPEEMMDKWEESHKEFVEKTAWIKQMQNM